MRICRLLSILVTGAAAIAAPPTAGRREIPLFFIPNQGQSPVGVRFMAKGSGVTAYFLSDEVAYRASGIAVHMRFLGSEPSVHIEGAGELSGKVNFLSGPERNWRTGVPAYSGLHYRGLYPGIDMSYGIDGRNLKSEFTVAPNADPGQIRMQYIASARVEAGSDGSLIVHTEQGTFRELPPVAWQVRNGRQAAVRAEFAIDADGAVRFTLGDYDSSLPLVIDPLIAYSTLLGGSSADAANAIAVDANGAAYIAGFTESYDFPTLNADQPASGGGNDAFIAKLSASGNALIYCTYLGGAGDDRAFGIAIDSSGAAYVTGSTQSLNFPVRNAYQANLAGGKNAFIAKLTPSGNNLAYSTYLGGNGSDAGNGIAVDSGGNVYVVGDTTSTNFPVNSYQHTYHGGQDAFIAKLNAAGSALGYSTYLGGGNTDHGAAVAVDSTGAAFVTGSTSSLDFPVLNALQTANGGGQDAFLTRLNPAGTALLFSTYLGGNGGSTGYPESGQGVALDPSGNVYVAGVTSSINFPVLNPLQSTLDGATDAFVAEVSPAGSLLYSTYLGGSGMDTANAIAVDANGYAYVVGSTYSTDFPVASPVQTSIGSIGNWDAFVSQLAPGGSSLVFATYLGGSDSDSASGVAVDSSGGIYVAGWTLSSNFPVQNALQSQNAGDYGAFVTKYVSSAGPANVSVTPNSGSGTSGTFTFQYSDSNGVTDFSVVSALFGNSSSSLASSCAVIFNRVQNTLALLTDSGAQPTATVTPGSGSEQNSQCILNGGGSSVTLSGNILTLTLALTFQPAFTGAKNVYMQAANLSLTTPWQTEGTWTVPASISMFVTPSSGAGAQQTFSLQFNDSSGAADLTTVGVSIGASTSTASACVVVYNRAQNALALLTDSGTMPATTLTPGSGTAQNSQCILSGSGSSAALVSDTLALGVQITFLPAFYGTKNIYMEATGESQSIGWTQEGTWVTGASFVAGAISSPTPGSTLSGSTVTFQWSAGTGTGTGYWLRVGTTGAGSYDISDAEYSGTSATVSGIPTNGGTVYVQLYSLNLASNTWVPISYTYTAAGSGSFVPGAITSPNQGSTLSGSTVTFTWSAGTGTGNGHWLRVGTTGVGSYDVSDLEYSGTSATVSGIPTNGGTVYVQLYSLNLASSTWVPTSYTYTAAASGSGSSFVAAAIASPSQGSTLSGSTVTFTWNAGTGTGNGYWLRVGTTGVGSYDVSDLEYIGTSATVSGIPTNGGTVYVALYSLNLATSAWVSASYAYTAGLGSGLSLVAAAITSPSQGSTLSGSTVTFTWSAGTGTGNGHWLRVGTTGVGSYDISDLEYSAASATVSGIPTDGATVYVQLYSLNPASNTWVPVSYTYTAAASGSGSGSSFVAAAIASPSQGSALSGSTVTFTWGAAAAAGNGYWLRVGTTGVGSYDISDLEYAGTSATVSGIPTNGATVYVQLYSLNPASNTWVPASYTYTAVRSSFGSLWWPLRFNITPSSRSESGGI